LFFKSLICKESKNHTLCFPWSKKATCLRLSARQAGQEKRGRHTDGLFTILSWIDKKTKNYRFLR